MYPFSRLAVAPPQEVQGVPQADGGPDACGQEGSPHQADYARKLIKLAREEVHV